MGGITYQEPKQGLELCPNIALKTVNCNSGAARFVSCSIISQPYATSNGSSVNIELEKYEEMDYTRSEMMVQFMLSNLHLKEEAHRLWGNEIGTRRIPTEELVRRNLASDNPNRLKNKMAEAKRQAITNASEAFESDCSVPVSGPAPKLYDKPPETQDTAFSFKNTMG